MERGKHGEFELEGIFGGNFEWDKFVVVVFGDFDVEGLGLLAMYCRGQNNDNLRSGS